MGRVGHQEEEPGWGAWGGLKGFGGSEISRFAIIWKMTMRAVIRLVMGL